MKVCDEVMKGSSAAVLRKMVKNFGLSDVHDPINKNPPKPVLLISDHLDMDRTVLEKSAEKQLAELNILRRLKMAILLKMKGTGRTFVSGTRT